MTPLVVKEKPVARADTAGDYWYLADGRLVVRNAQLGWVLVRSFRAFVYFRKQRILERRARRKP